MKRIALLHGAGYAGGELIRLLSNHPEFSLEVVTSRSFAGRPVWEAHPALRNQTTLEFSGEELDSMEFDALLIAAEHGKSVSIVAPLLEAGYEGCIVDLSADFRLKDPLLYQQWYGYDHPAPELLDRFVYGMAELTDGYPADAKYVANPGCFATGISLALWPVSRHLKSMNVAVTALTGASGSGASPKTTTHYPTRDGNVRAYKALKHQHLPEIVQVTGAQHRIDFTPVSGPWTRGIWGTAHIALEDEISSATVESWFREAYDGRKLIRLWPGQLPELRFAAGSPFCDIGWTVEGSTLVLVFAIDNLLKGAASQAVQNLNLLFDLPETCGLLPASLHTMAE